MSSSPTEKSAAEKLPELNLREIVTPLFRQRTVLLWTFGVVFAIVILVALIWAPTYYVASMQVLVEQTRTDAAVSAGQNTPPNSRQVSMDQVNSEVTLLQGADMLRKVVDACGLANYDHTFRDYFRSGDDEHIKMIKRESAAVGLSKALKVTVDPGSDVIDVKYGKSGLPAVPACVLQNLGQLYLEKHVQLQRPEGSSEFFTVETDNYHKILNAAEAKLTQFSNEAGVAAPDLIRTDLAQQSATSEAALGQARQAVATDLKRIENEKAQMVTTPARAQTSQVSLASNLLLQNLQTDLLNSKIRRAQLVLKFDPSYPLVKEVDSEIALTEASIKTAEEAKYSNQTTDRDQVYEFLREDIAKTEADLATQRAQVDALQQSIASLHKEMVRMDALAVQQSALERDAKAAEGNYLLYLTKREQARISDALDKKGIANVAIAVPAVVPVLHAYPPTKILLFGFPFAVLMGITAAYVAEYLDPSLRTPSEVSEALGLPVLAAIPL